MWTLFLNFKMYVSLEFHFLDMCMCILRCTWRRQRSNCESWILPSIGSSQAQTLDLSFDRIAVIHGITLLLRESVALVQSIL